MNQVLESAAVVIDNWRRADQPGWHGGFGDPVGVVPTAIRAARLIDGSGARRQRIAIAMSLAGRR